MPDDTEIRDRMDRLASEIVRHQTLYYLKARPEISDKEYDRLFDELLRLEREYPGLAAQDSPTKRVGSDLDNEFPEVPHRIPMLSLDKVYAEEQLLEWIEKIKKDTDRPLSFVVEEKIDGSTIVLHYENGVLVRAVTRGDGFVGNDITENVRTIRDVPLSLTEPVTAVFRGEIYLNLSDFERLNREVDNIYANPRNFAAGSLRRKKSAEVARIPLRSFVYEGFFDDLALREHIAVLHRIFSLGFRVGKDIGFFTPDDAGSYGAIFDDHPEWVHRRLEDLPGYIAQKKEGRSSLDYEIDGLVVKADDYQLRNRLGSTSHHPRWAMAFKFEAPQAVSVINAIEVQVGRTGRVTPVARIEPVTLSGTTVSNVTLHNQDYIKSLDIAVGDRVAVTRRGDVIPAVEEVLQKNNEGYDTFDMPERCPSCRTSLVIEGAHHFCPNRDCPARVYGKLSFFCGRGQMDIENLGGETIRKLMDLGLVRDIPDIYRFDPKDLLGHEGFAEKKVALIREGIAGSKKKPFSIVLASLGLDEIGPKVTELIIEAGYTSIDRLIEDAKKGDPGLFTRIEGIGPKIAKKLIDQLGDPEVIAVIERLKEAGLKLSAEEGETIRISDAFAGEVWCVTGSFDLFKPRELAMEEVKKRGGKVASSVTGNTTHLLTGENPGSKLEKAKKLGVAIVTEQEFTARLSG
ncbi:MAG: NAD-dependent DNA ligase LigA [Spirochaetes bacterium]|nr:NAD-dependent DNA ligase LigA [Spirochaetota bacterium]